MDNFNKDRLTYIRSLIITMITFLVLIFSYLTFNEHENVLKGLITIITSPAVLITDFLVIGGLGATFINAFLILIFNFTLVKLLRVRITGVVLAAFFTVFGFSFFGKNIINILPIYIGGILYSKYEHVHFREILPTIMFTSALAPFISEVAFRIEASEFSYINAIALGTLIGFVITPLAKKMAGFHEGFNLYNLGFTGGILGAVITSILKAYHFTVTPQRLISTEYDFDLKVLCFSSFLALIIIGWFINEKSFKGFKNLVADSGYKSDFTAKYGFGLTYINMGITGFVSTFFVMLLGETLNGPLIAGILTVVGFSAYGKHFRNIIPILLGVFLASIGTTSDGFVIALSALFGTSLAPMSGVYGVFWGTFAGWLHFAVVRNIGVVHGGLNLYNNGFSAGIVAGVLLPIIRTFREHKDQRTQKYYLKKKKLYTLMMDEEKEDDDL